MRTDTITSGENKWLKIFRSALRGTGPTRDECIGVEGPKFVGEALRSGLEAEALLVSESAEELLDKLLRTASESDTGIPRSRIFRTTSKLFAGVSGTESPQGIAALFRQRGWGFEDVLRGTPKQNDRYERSSPLVVVLAEIQDPGNVGTILRSAEAFGATGTIATRGTADPWSPKAIRASAGSSLRLPLLRGMAMTVVLAQLRIQQVKIYAASTIGNKPSDSLRCELQDAAAIFIGNEGAGLPAEVERAADARISIPIADAVESLNVAVAASILLYEVDKIRRRTV